MADVDVIVVGAGVAGSATARALAKRGRDVLLLEQFEIGHARGSSHGTSRIFRFSYDDPAFVRMAMQTLPMWRELEAECGRDLLRTTGGLDSGVSVGANARALSECGASYKMLDPDDVMRRWPAMRFSEATPLLYQPDSGITFADVCVRALVDSAVNAGAELREKTVVRAVAVEGPGAVIETDSETLRAGAVVVAAGGWARRLLAGLSIDLPIVPTRQTVVYFRTDDPYELPTLVEWDDEQLFYALPAPGMGLKAGWHVPGPEIDPDEPGETDDRVVEALVRRVEERYPGLDPTPAAAETCIYTNTSDERFIIERRGPVVIGSACSGHGFKFGPLTGKRLADLAVEVLTPHE